MFNIVVTSTENRRKIWLDVVLRDIDKLFPKNKRVRT